MIEIFLVNSTMTMLALLLFSFVGGFAILPFNKNIKFSLLATPLAGILILTVGIALFYGGLTFRFQTSVILTFVISTAFTIIYYFYTKPKLSKQFILYLLTIILVSIFIGYLCNYTSIQFAHPGFLFMDGTDQLGYVQASQWIIHHLGNAYPPASPKFPNLSWTAHLYSGERRFGSFYLLGAISIFRRLPPMFAYDFACGVILSVGCISVSAIFSRSRKTFILLLVSLLISYWFVYSRTGFFAKLITYPSLLLVIGLTLNYFTNEKNQSLAKLSTLTLLICSISTAYPGNIVAILFSFVLLIYILFSMDIDYYSRPQPTKLLKIFLNHKDQLFLIAFLSLLALATYASLALPNPSNLVNNQATNRLWIDILPKLVEIIARPVTHARYGIPIIVFVIGISLNIIFLIISIKRNNKIASSLIFSPLFLLSILLILNKRWAAYEITGIFHPLTLCGIAWILDNKYSKKLLILFLIVIAVRLPLSLMAIGRYSFPTAKKYSHQFSKNQLDNLSNVIGKKSVIVNITDKMFSLPLLIYLPGKGNQLNWTPSSWHAILEYRNWPAPKISSNNRLYLIKKSNNKLDNCEVLFETRQYQLIRC